MNGKGDKQRPRQIRYDKWVDNYDRIFRGNLMSECCGASSRYGLDEFNGEHLGICDACGEHAGFYDDDSDGEDWDDMVENMVDKQ